MHPDKFNRADGDLPRARQPSGNRIPHNRRGVKFKTEIIPMQDMLASITADAFGKAEGDSTRLAYPRLTCKDGCDSEESLWTDPTAKSSQLRVPRQTPSSLSLTISWLARSSESPLGARNDEV